MISSIVSSEIRSCVITVIVAAVTACPTQLDGIR